MALNTKRGYGGVFMADLELAVAPMHRICKKAGAERVSEAAAKELAEALEEIGIKIAKEALDFAMHAGRKTIKAEDIEIAAKKVMGK
jgi:histone H3/H4